MTVAALLTLVVAATGVVAVLGLGVVGGLIAFLAILLVYPDYLRVSIGTIDISACRIVISALLLRCLADPRILRQFQWKTLDSLLVASMVVYALTLAFTTDLFQVLENRAGFVMDTLFVYLVVRFVVVDRVTFVTIAKAASLMAAFLALHAVIEMFTGLSLYTGLGQYCPWAATKGMEYQTRFGLNRAMGPPGETILFGLSFAALVPMIWMLRYEPPPWGRWAPLATAIACIGVGATVSSGPYLALLVVLACLALEYGKSLVRPLIVVVVLGCAAIEIFSNRHFYHVLAQFTMDPVSGWYRARLIDVAIMKLPDYWLAGYGFEDPGWGPMINSLPRTDAVNDYIVQAIRHGVFGLLLYTLVLGRGLYDVIRCHALTASPWMKSCCWATGSTLLGLVFAMWSVSLFGQMTSQLYFLLGLHGALAVRAVAIAPARASTFGGYTAPVLRGAATRIAQVRT